MINNDWQALRVGLLDTREITRIVASNTTRIDVPMWLWSEPCLQASMSLPHHKSPVYNWVTKHISTCLDGAGVLEVRRLIPFPMTLTDVSNNEQYDGQSSTEQREHHQERETIDQTLDTRAHTIIHTWGHNKHLPLRTPCLRKKLSVSDLAVTITTTIINQNAILKLY